MCGISDGSTKYLRYRVHGFELGYMVSRVQVPDRGSTEYIASEVREGGEVQGTGTAVSPPGTSQFSL